MASASSHAVWAVIIGLRGKATAMPVARSSDGAAWWAATTDSHGGWRISVNTIPANPAAATSPAKACTPFHVPGSVITSRSTCRSSRVSTSPPDQQDFFTLHVAAAAAITAMETAYLLDNRSAHAPDRFGALAAAFDDVTFRHLDALGVAAGWRCWEVGAGGPSVPTWLAARAGAGVLATDLDVRWLDTDQQYEVRQHDVVTERPPGGDFDLVHVRLVLTHLPARDVVLRTIADALRPGGWLLVEDFDMALQPCAVLDAHGPQQHLANRIRAGFATLLRERGVDPEFGRTLPRRLRDVGLVDVGADAYLPLAVPATAALEQANVEQVRSALVAIGAATDDEIDAHLTALAAGSLDVSTPPLVSAWGRRP